MIGPLLLALAVAAIVAGIIAIRLDDRGAAQDALHDALERGEIGPEQYAAHLRAVDHAA